MTDQLQCAFQGMNSELDQEIFAISNHFLSLKIKYWEHTHLIIDVVPGRGGMFSLEGPTGKRFLTRSRVFTDQEYNELKNYPAKHAKEITEYEGLKTTS